MNKSRLPLVVIGLISLGLFLICSPINRYSFVWNEITMYVVYAIFTAYCMFRLKNLSSISIFLAVFIGWGVLNIPLRFLSGTAVSVPNFVMNILGMLAGYAYYYTTIRGFKIRRYLLLVCSVILLAIICPVHNKWLHYVSYGNFSGKIDAEPIKPFSANSFRDADSTLVIGERADHYYVIDFWGSGCGVCWRKFPKFQEFYDRFKNKDKLTICAIALQKDNKLDSEFDYSFPVYYCRKEFVAEHVKCVPTYIIIYNQQIVYRGGVEELMPFINRKLNL